MKKTTQKVAHNRPRPFFFSPALTAQNSPELHFRFINFLSIVSAKVSGPNNFRNKRPFMFTQNVAKLLIKRSENSFWLPIIETLWTWYFHFTLVFKSKGILILKSREHFYSCQTRNSTYIFITSIFYFVFTKEEQS